MFLWWRRSHVISRGCNYILPLHFGPLDWCISCQITRVSKWLCLAQLNLLLMVLSKLSKFGQLNNSIELVNWLALISRQAILEAHGWLFDWALTRWSICHSYHRECDFGVLRISYARFKTRLRFSSWILELCGLTVHFGWGLVVHFRFRAHLITWTDLALRLLKKQFIEKFKYWFSSMSSEQVVVNDVLCVLHNFLKQELGLVFTEYQ